MALAGFRPHQAEYPRPGAYGSVGVTAPAVPLLAGRNLVDSPSGEDKQPAAYVCRDFACQAPVTDPEALQVVLEQT